VFDIAFSELVVIGIVMLVVIGPKRLPEVARSAGVWMGRLRRFVADVKRDMDTELRRDELAELRKVKDQLTETRQLFESTASGTLASLGSIGQFEPATSVDSGATPALASAPASATKSTRKKSARRAAAKPKTVGRKKDSHGRRTRKSR